MNAMKKLLFLGDSLTDCYHNFDSDSLGEGYVRMIAESLHYGQGEVSVTNKGIDGFTLPLLLRLWKNECTKMQPDAISILIGVNDAGVIMENEPSASLPGSAGRNAFSASLDDFRIGFRALIEEIRKTCSCPVFVLEPFIFSRPAEYAAWRPLLASISAIEQDESDRFRLRFLPLQEKLDTAVSALGFDEITLDGIHLTTEGHRILADTFLRAWRELTP
jgi:acyl-CoA thioesterase-1